MNMCQRSEDLEPIPATRRFDLSAREIISCDKKIKELALAKGQLEQHELHASPGFDSTQKEKKNVYTFLGMKKV